MSQWIPRKAVQTGVAMDRFIIGSLLYVESIACGPYENDIEFMTWRRYLTFQIFVTATANSM